MKRFLQRLSRFHKSLQPYIHVFKEVRWELKYLKLKERQKPGKRMGVMRVDGRSYHGGMTDRFKGAISWWHYCEKNNLEFKLYYVHPFNLTDYVVPNEYDWTVKEEDIPDNWRDTRIFYARGEKGHRLERLKSEKNIWYYGNIDLGSTLGYAPYTNDWGKVFKKLFKPSPFVNKHLDELKLQIGNDYIAVVFRFQNLLGDFNEPYRKISDPKERENLIERVLNELDDIHKKEPGKTILVTSDSESFLTIAKKRDYVFVIEGKLVHMEFTEKDSGHTQLKSFLDFFMIANSSKVYSVVIGDMYKSDFPVYAAKVNGIPFERIEK